MRSDERPGEGDAAPVGEQNIPLSDGPLLDLLDALVEQRGKVAASKALGVNYRTMMNCYDSRHVSRRMRQALEEFRDAGEASGTEVDDDGAADEVEALRQRVAELEEEARGLRGLVETQAGQLEELGRRVAAPEGKGRQPGDTDTDGVDGRQQDWWPPSRGHGLPDAGVVTLEEQPDEEQAFGPAVPLVVEWRALRTGVEALGSRVDRARATVRRWELEVAMLEDFRLTLPPETEPLNASRREDHVRWRKEALAEARQELAKAKRLHWLRRVLTLGLWWR